MFGIFKKFKEGLAKTVAAIATRTHGLFGGRKIDAASLDELEEALYTADFGVETTNEIIAEIKAAYQKDKDLQGRQAATTLSQLWVPPFERGITWSMFSAGALQYWQRWPSRTNTARRFSAMRAWYGTLT